MVILGLAMVPSAARVDTAVYAKKRCLFMTGGRICGATNVCCTGLAGSLGYSSIVTLRLFIRSVVMKRISSTIYGKSFCCGGKFIVRRIGGSAVVRHLRGDARNYSSVFEIGLSVVPSVVISAAVTVGSKRDLVFKNGALAAPNTCARAFASRAANYSSVIGLALVIKANVSGVCAGDMVVTPGPVGTKRAAFVINS